MKKIISYKEFLNESKTITITEGVEEQIKKECISKLSDFFGCAPGNLSKFNFDGKDNIKELTKALRSTSDEGTAQYYRVAVMMAKRDLGIHESEDLNESAIEIAGGIILGIVGLKVIGGIAKGLFGTLKLKAMKDPEKLKELASQIASKAMEKNPLKAALWLGAVKKMIDSGDIKDGFDLIKTSTKMDSIDVKKVFEAEGFDLTDDVNEANISMYKSMVQNVLKDLDVEVKQSDLKVGTKKSDSWSFVTLNGHVLCSDTAYDQMVAWAKAAIKEDPAKYGLPTSLKESEEFEINEAAATPEELASFIQKEEKHFAAFLKPKKLTATVSGKVVTIKPASGSFTITVDYAKSTIDTTGKPERPESTSYVELMEYLKITKFKLNESEEVNEGKKEDLSVQLEAIFDQIKNMNLDKNAELIFVKNHIALGFLNMLSKPGAIKTIQDKSPEAKKRLIDAQAALNSAKSTEEIKSILVGLVDTINEE